MKRLAAIIGIITSSLPAYSGGLLVISPARGNVFVVNPASEGGYCPPARIGDLTADRQRFSVAIRPKQGMTIPDRHEIVIRDTGSVDLRRGNLFFRLEGPARIRILNSKMDLILGTLVSASRPVSGNLSFSVDISPSNPVPGDMTVFRLRTKGISAKPRIIIPGKKKCMFYPLPSSGSGKGYIARVGFDCRDTRREQPYRILLTLKNGSHVEIRNTLLLHDWRHRQRDPLKEFSWSSLPKKPDLFVADRITHPFLTRLDRTLFTTEKPDKNGPDTTPGKKDTPPPARFRPTISLPLAKRRLYSKRAAIRKESRIHWRSTATSSPRRLWQGRFIFPGHHWFSSIFGEMRFWSRWSAWAHRGIDIAAPMGAAVIAPNNGIIRFAGHTVLCGNNIIIDHGQFVFSKIFHLSSIAVRSGQYVKKGQIIGRTGSTGISTGPHIHWEMWVGGTKVDPNRWVLGPAALTEPRLPAGGEWKRLYRFLSPGK